MAKARKTDSKKESKEQARNFIKQAVVFGSSIVYLTKGVSDDIVKELEKSKVISKGEGKETAEKIRSELRQKSTSVKENILAQIGRVINDLSEAAKKQEAKQQEAKQSESKKKTTSKKRTKK